jgi:hypothetical protein
MVAAVLGFALTSGKPVQHPGVVVCRSSGPNFGDKSAS